MKKHQFTNSEIAATDWAQEERAKALFRLNQQKFKVPPPSTLGSGWGRDVSGADKRSVKAQLAGRGDFRAAWWRAFSSAYLLLVPTATLEGAMYRFHSMHHWITLARIGFMLDVRQLHASMARNGVAAALQGAIATASNRR